MESAMNRQRDREKQRAYERAWYARNAEQAKAKVKARKQALVAWFRDYKATVRCTRCGEDHPATLDFHHRNPDEKDFAAFEISHRSWGKARILREIAKCDVLCANCHRKLHYTMLVRNHDDDRANLVFPSTA
jgi:hypothetical protein